VASADDLSHLFDSVVGTVTLRASDKGRQRNFYEDGIGLVTSYDEGGVTELRGAGDLPLVRLDASAAGGAEPVRVPHTGLFHTAFRYPDRASLAAAVARTAPLAREFQGASDHGVSEAIYFADPEGNGIELYRDRSFYEWPQADPGTVAMFTAPLDLPGLLSEAAADGAEEAPDIGHIHLMTADAGRALAFWRDDVGLDERQRFGPSAVFLAEGLYHHHIGANSWHSAGAGPAPPDRPGLESFELRLRDHASVEVAAEGLERAGIAVERDGSGVTFRDVDGHRVHVLQRT
jgi:catechol 2,3-dioxygenase